GCMFYRNNLFLIFQITILQYAGDSCRVYTAIGIEQRYAPKHSSSVLLSEDIVHLPSYDDMFVLLMDFCAANRGWQSAAYGKLFVIQTATSVFHDNAFAKIIRHRRVMSCTIWGVLHKTQTNKTDNG